MDSRYPDTIRQLVASFPQLSPELKKAARYLVDHPEEVGLNSLRKVAESAGVNPATLTRLTKKLGFIDYDTLRAPFCQRLRQLSPGFSSRLQEVQQRGAVDGPDLLNDVLASELANIESALSPENRSSMVAATDRLLNCERIFTLGLRGSYAPAFIFQYALQMFRENSELVETRAGIFGDRLRDIGPNDCLVTVAFPPYTVLTIDMIEYAAEAGAEVIAITDSVVSPAAMVAKHAICVGSDSPSFYHSFTGAIVAVQALITLLVSRSGGDAVTVIEEAERQLSRVSAYW